MPSWNRMFRKSVSSSSSGGDQSTLSNPTTAASSSPPSDAGLAAATNKSPPPTPSSSKSSSWRFGWGGNSNATSEDAIPELSQMKKKKKKPKRGSAAVHPSERELTEQNLRHQELLSAFTMSFGRSGARKQSAGGRTSGSGVSPGCSRSASLDSGYAQGGHHHGQGQRLSAAGAPQMEDVRE